METVTLTSQEVFNLLCSHEKLGCIPHSWMDDSHDFRTGKHSQEKYQIPIVPDLDAKILEQLDHGGLNMEKWHTPKLGTGLYADMIECGENFEPQYKTCGTTHCLAGWAVALGGEAGYKLEFQTGPRTAGTLIFLLSTGRVPDFYASDHDAMAGLRQRAVETQTQGCR